MTLKFRVLYVRVRAVGLLVGQAVNLLNAGYLTGMCKPVQFVMNRLWTTLVQLQGPVLTQK